MAGAPPSPQQLPRIDLPGAEYFSLVPNRTVAIQGRRAARINIPSTSVPASGTQGAYVQATIENPFPTSAGIYIHDMWTLYIPGDASGNLVVSGFQMGLGVNPANASDLSYRIGIPLATQQSPNQVQMIANARDQLIHKQDILFCDTVDANALVFAATIAVRNTDATNPHTFSGVAFIFYTRLDGIVI